MTAKTNQSVKNKLGIIKEFGLKKGDLVVMLRNIFLSREVDNAEIRMKKQNKAFFQISGAGHEGILTAAAMTLRPSYDHFFCYYRDRALCLGLGVSAYEMLCQANGNVGDTASYGRQMPSHWGNKKLNIITKSSCTGTQYNQAIGYAEGGVYCKKNSIKETEVSFKNDEIVYVSGGDGTTAEGEFWEGLLNSCIKKLPIMFLVEDNGYAISVPNFLQTPGGSISKALKNFPNLTTFECNGNCPLESYKTVQEAASFLRKREGGPVLVHAHVTRPYSHSLSDDHAFYRTKKELEEEAKEDVFNSFPRFLIQESLLKKELVQEIHDEVISEVKKATKDAIETKWPGKETIKKYLYSPSVDICGEQFCGKEEIDGGEDLSMAQALNRTLKSEFQKNSLIRVFGEDVADVSENRPNSKKGLKGKGGVFKVTHGLQPLGKKEQIFNSSLAEASIVGQAVGMAIRGLKPVVEIQFFDYIWPAFMQLKNEMATTRFRSGGDFSCPMVVRVPIGGYLKGGAIYHSQSGESFFTHIPGLHVAVPSNARDAAGLLRTAIRADDPVMFFEHKHLYYQGYNRSPYPGDDFMIPFGKAKIVQEGSDVTLICWGATVQKSVEACKKLVEDQVSVEIIDLRTLAPLDLDTIVNSLRKTNRLLIVHEENKTSGFAGEITALINEKYFNLLDAPILRVCSEDTYVAYCPALEEEILVHERDILEKLSELISY